METCPEKINLNDYLIDEGKRLKHSKNTDILRLAIANVNLSRELELTEGLTYVCSDGCVFEMRTPDNERVFRKQCNYGYREPRVVVATHHVLLKNGWIKEPVNVHDLADLASKVYEPITGNISRRDMRASLTNTVYARKIFKVDEKGTIAPIFLPVKIEL
jgi:hypothetical protein